MNKIYKVIWSKTRNCYVAVAEFVKRNGKGGSVLNRRHIAAALAAVAVCAAPTGALANSGGHWDVGDYIGDAPDYKVVIDSNVDGWVYGRLESGSTTATRASVTVTSGTVGSGSSLIEVYGGRSYYGNAEKNTVSISGGTVNGWVYGGSSYYGNAEKNTVFISGGKVNSVRGGYSRSNSGTATASDNEVTISGGSVDYVYGGGSDSGSVTKNTVTISGGTVNWNVYGGDSSDSDATNNTVTISGGSVEGNVYGGYSNRGSATNNTVILSKVAGKEAPVIKGTLFGGYSGRGGTVSGNTLQVEAVDLSAPEIQNFDNYRFVLPDGSKKDDVLLSLNKQDADLTIDGSKVDVSMGGGTIADIGLTLDESVTLLHKTGGSGAFSVNNSNKAVYTKTLDDAAGGLPEDIYSLTASEDKLNVTYTERYLYGEGGTNTPGQREKGNTLNITDGAKATAAFGGRATASDVTGNKVIMSGGEIVDRGVIQIGNRDVSGDLYGGFADTGNAVKNAVELSGGTVAYDVYGGYSEQGNVEKNTVTITGGTADDVLGGYSDYGNAESNTVTITGGTVDDDVYGGYSYSGNAEKNTVTISGGTVDDNVRGGYSYSGNAENNTVTISGGTVEEDVVGGYSWKGAATSNTVTISGGTVEYAVVGGDSYYGNAESNTVTISGGKVNGDVYGGYSSTRNATGNKVILSKQEGGTAPVISGTLFGGFSDDGGTVSNNTLQVEAVGLSAPEIQNFDNYRFVLPSDIEANEVMLELKNQGSKLEIDANRVDMAVAKGSGLNIDFGESVTLLEKTGGSGAFSVENLTGAVQTSKLDGVSTGFDVMKYTLDKPANEDKLNVTVSELWLYGDGGTNTKGQREMGNTLTINGGKANAAFGGRAAASDVTGNKVEMSGGELVRLSDSSNPDYNVSGNLYGGYTDAGNVQGNTVEMSGGKVDSIVVGGFSKAGAAGGDKPEDGNKVIMTGGEAREVMGGYTYDGAAGYNTVSVSNAKVAHATGGASLQGDAVGNTVTLTNTELSYKVTGGDAYRGRAAENTVTIDGGSVGMNVYGGVSISGNVENNTVSIRGGKINGVLDGLKTGLTGGYGSERVVGNTVAITGGELFVESVYGGYHTSRSGSGLAEKNVVTLGGGSYDAGLNVIGGGSNNEANDNAVNLTGTTQGLEGAKLYGWKETEDGATVTGTGNELHIGGAKTYDKNGTATITKGSWQGMDASGKHTNRVDTVSNFDSIALHHVVWGDVPAISAKEIKNIGGLDVTGLEFFTHPDNSMVHEHALKDYMVLVHGDNNDLTGLKISYLDEGNVKTEALTNQGIHYRNTVHHSTENGVTVDGKEVKRIFLADHNKSIDFFYHITGDKLTVGEVNFVKGGTARILDGRFDVRNAAIDTEGLTFTAASKLQMAAGDAMTLVDAEDAIANKNGATLQPFTAKQIANAYNFTPAEGVTVAATLRGTLNATPKNNGLVYKVSSNQADKLTFGSVDWKDSGALFKRPAAVTFAGANVDTSEIHFKNLKELQGNAQMTLVSDFGGNPGRITGTTYKIGTTLEGEGAASLVNGDLIFTTKAQEKKRVQEQTHNTVMGMTAGLAALSGGTEQISQAMDILSLMDGFGGTTGSGSTGSTGNAGDNTTNGSGSSDSRENSGGGGAGQEENEREANGSIIASVGGGHLHQETGSHVTSNTWNGVLGIGGKRAVKSGTWQYAAFAEHGRANFTLHSDAGRGDGTSKYTGGGLLAKWQNRHDVYVEGSLRAGRMHDTASDLLYDAATGQSYGYDVHANYIGGHVGFGKVFRYNNGRSLDVYGKYFHMKRDGVSFEAEGHYDLDSVTSSVLRVGARYGATDKKWNWYGGLAYEYEFDGKATGRADGAEIRAASIKGGSVRGELGLRMEATKTSPWKADIRLTGYAGKRRGIGGNVSVAYTF